MNRNTSVFQRITVTAKPRNLFCCFVARVDVIPFFMLSKCSLCDFSYDSSFIPFLFVPFCLSIYLSFSLFPFLLSFAHSILSCFSVSLAGNVTMLSAYVNYHLKQFVCVYVCVYARARVYIWHHWYPWFHILHRFHNGTPYPYIGCSQTCTNQWDSRTKSWQISREQRSLFSYCLLAKGYMQFRRDFNLGSVGIFDLE